MKFCCLVYKVFKNVSLDLVWSGPVRSGNSYAQSVRALSTTEVMLSNITLFSLSASGSAAAHEKKSLLTMGFIVATPR